MANTFKFGAGEWYGKKDTILAYNDENKNYKPLPFTFSRDSTGTIVNKDGLIETVGVDEPRVDYLDNADGHLLLEPSRTNSITYSNDLSQSIYNGDLRTNSVYGELGFNGENDAWRYTKDSSTSSGFINLTFSGTYTISLFIKKEANKGIYIYNFGDTNQFSKINIENGTYISGVDTVKIEKFSNDWFRVSQTLTVSNGVWYFYLTDGNGSQITTSITLQNLQIEQGSYPTSYIPTNGSSVTRAADVCNGAGNSEVFNDSEGVLYWECSSLYDDLTNRIISVSEGNQNNTVQLYFDASSNRVRGTVRAVDGTYQCILSYTASDTTAYIKAAIKYKDNDFSLWVNGVERAADTSGNAPTGLSKISFDSGSGSSDFYGKVKDLRVYNTALTDAELITLTT